jgi:hypothetical protein
MIRWMPEMMCIDTPYAYGRPEGSVFNNCLVRAKGACPFYHEVAIHTLTRARNVRSSEALACGLARKYAAAVPDAMKMVASVNYYAGLVEFTYTENGVAYQKG